MAELERLPEGRDDEGDGRGEVALDEVGGDAEDAVAEAAKEPVAHGVVELASSVNGAVDLDDEADAGSEEVDDEGVRDDLAAKANAEASAAQRLPEEALRACRMHANVASPRDEACEGDVVEAVTHGDLRAPRGPIPVAGASLSRVNPTTPEAGQTREDDAPAVE